MQHKLPKNLDLLGSSCHGLVTDEYFHKGFLLETSTAVFHFILLLCCHGEAKIYVHDDTFEK